jgi:hypothetical protein
MKCCWRPRLGLLPGGCALTAQSYHGQQTTRLHVCCRAAVGSSGQQSDQGKQKGKEDTRSGVAISEAPG